MSQLRALLPLPVVQPMDSVLSPVSTGPGLLHQASSAELVGELPRRTRETCQETDAASMCGGDIGW